MGLSVLRLAGGAAHGSESDAGLTVARRSSANPRAACARFLHGICERERDRHQSQRSGYPFGGGDPASLPSPRRQRRERKKAPRMSKQPESSTFSFSPALLLHVAAREHKSPGPKTSGFPDHIR